MTLIRKDVLGLTTPIVTEQTFIMLMGVINAIMAGHVGKEAVSAIGMVDSINNIFIAFFSALAVGGTVVVAHYTGHNDINNANETAKQAVYSGLTIALVITAAILLFRQPLLNLLYGSAEKDVIANAYTYLNITLLTYPLIALTSIACGVLRGAGDTKTPMKVTISMNIINVVLSYFFIYGLEIKNAHFYIHISGMNVKGAALGIATARSIGAITVMYVLLKGSKVIKLSQIRSFKLNVDIQKSIFGVGVPAGVESLLFNGGKLITQVFIVGMGTVAIAANYIAGSISSLINIPGSALSIAATTLVGQNMGRGESEEAKSTLLYLTKLSSVCLLVLCGLSFPTAGLLASMYTSSGDVVAMSAHLIRLFAIATPLLWSFSFLLPAGLKGAGDAKYTMVSSFISMWAFRITLGYIFGIPLKLGVAGIWLGMFVDWLVRGVLYYRRLRGDKWKQNVVIKQNESRVSRGRGC